MNGFTLPVLHQVFVALAPPGAWWILPSHSPWKTASLQLLHAILFPPWMVPISPLESKRKGAINSGWGRFLMGISPSISSTEASAGRGLGQVKHRRVCKHVLPWRWSYIFFGQTWHRRDQPYQGQHGTCENTILSLCFSLALSGGFPWFIPYTPKPLIYWYLHPKKVSRFPCSFDTINNLDIASAMSIASAGPQGLCPALGCSGLGILIIWQRIVHL